MKHLFSKIVYKIGHFVNLEAFISEINSKTIDNSRRIKEHNLNKEVLYTERKRLGIGLKHLGKLVAVAKIMNIRNTLLPSNSYDDNKTFLKSKWLRLLKQDLKKENIDADIHKNGKIEIQYFFKTLEIAETMKSKEVYDFFATICNKY